MELFLSSQTEQCGGHCLCVEYDNTPLNAPDGTKKTAKILQAGSDGACPTGSVPITNTIREIEYQLNACACANRLSLCLCAQFAANEPG